MATHLPSLTLIESSCISPPPGSTPNKSSIPLTFFDIPWSITPPVERLFFYSFPHTTSLFLSSFLPSLKSSLSLTLKSFYPLAGHIRLTPATDTKYEIYYVEGDFVSLTVVECDGRFGELCTSEAREVSRLEPFVPQLPKNSELQPVFAVQVTVFPEQGIAIGIAVHHMSCDGTSSMQFMHSWATTCRSGDPVSSPRPVIDRTSVSDPSDIYSVLYNITSSFSTPTTEGIVTSITAPANFLLASFTLPLEHIQRLKQMVSAKAEESKRLFHCSTIVVAFAYIWVRYVKARSVEMNKTHHLLFPADFRARMQPPLPENYFGNAVGSCVAKAEPSDLIGEDGFFLAAEAIGMAIEGLSAGEKLVEDWVTVLRSFMDWSFVSAAGSPKFRVYDVDFGWGRPAKVEILSVAKTGALAIAESRDEKGGIEIGLSLSKNEMDKFENYFVGGLNF